MVSLLKLSVVVMRRGFRWFGSFQLRSGCCHMYRRWSNVVVPGWRKVRNYPRWNYPVRPRITRYVGGPEGPEPALGERADPAPNLRIVVRSSQQTPLRRHGRLGVSMHGIMPVVDTGSPGPSHIRLCQCRHGPDFHAGAAAARRAWERTH